MQAAPAPAAVYLLNCKCDGSAEHVLLGTPETRPCCTKTSIHPECWAPKPTSTLWKCSTLGPTKRYTLHHAATEPSYLYQDKKKWPYSLCQLPPWLTKKPVSQLRLL